ncbi:hypothetical protein MNBD_ALPHA09-1524 [hydrothermal vent metagenome]|uniref:Uncharacterized protein n=1 Tax=hydrothermal vent metagenome TaxID=652676 RepID=A0A3B0TB45_9ZZZZ
MSLWPTGEDKAWPMALAIALRLFAIGALALALFASGAYSAIPV